MKSILDATIVGVLFAVSIMHMARLSNLIPDSWKGEYQLMAQKVMDRNVQ